MAAVLTVLTVALTIGVALAFGQTVLLLFAFTLPAPLMLLWLSVDVMRHDEDGR
jgi:hypothetical protein